MTLDAPTEAALERLREALAGYEDGLLVAMSGGVDSCTLAFMAHRVLGDHARAVTLDAESLAQWEVEAAQRFAKRHGLHHTVRRHSELADPEYVKNDALRCFHCRKNMASELAKLATSEELPTIAMGVLPEDHGEHRPGIRAAREAGIRFPYVEAEVSKDQVRAIARHYGLEVHDRPSNACLSSRIAYGLRVTEERLRQVEQAEALVRERTGARQVRVRHHGNLARIEVDPEGREALVDQAEGLARELRALGFQFVTMDLLGYRSGSMNVVLDDA